MNKYLWIVPFVGFLCGYLAMSIVYKSSTARVPALVGKPMGQALRIAASEGLSIRLASEIEDQDTPAGTIISQYPPAHTLIKTHQPIACVVSTKNESHVPQLGGLLLADIQGKLQSQGVALKVYEIESPAPVGMCIAQDPVAGTILSAKSIVVYVSKGNNKQVLFPDLRQKMVTEVYDFLSNVLVEISVLHKPEQAQDHVCSTCIVSDQRPRPGTIVRLDNQKPLKVQLIATPVEDGQVIHNEDFVA